MIRDATCPRPRGKCLVFCTSEAEMQEHAQHRAVHHALDPPCLLHADGLPSSHFWTPDAEPRHPGEMTGFFFFLL